MICKNTDRLIFRQLEDNARDKELVIELFWDISNSDISKQNETFIKIYNDTHWNEITKPNIFSVMIFLKETGEFVGRVCMQHTDTDLPEIGIDILKKHQNKGYGPESIKAFATWYCENNGISKIKVRIDKDNSHSRHIFEKLGAEYIGSSSYYSKKALSVLQEKLSNEIYKELTQDNVNEYILGFPLSI